MLFLFFPWLLGLPVYLALESISPLHILMVYILVPYKVAACKRMCMLFYRHVCNGGSPLRDFLMIIAKIDRKLL